MSELTVSGKLIVLNDSEAVSEKLTKRTFVVETAEQYPQSLLFEAINDKTKLLDKFKVSQDVTVSFNLRGREYKGKYFNTLSVWRIVAGEGVSEQPVDVSAAPDDDDLPF